MKDATGLDSKQPPVISEEVDAFGRIIALMERFAVRHGAWPDDFEDFTVWRQSAAAELADIEITREHRLCAWRIFDRYRTTFALRRLFQEERSRAPQDDLEFCAWIFEHHERLKDTRFKAADYDAAAALCSEAGLRALMSPAAGRA